MFAWIICAAAAVPLVYFLIVYQFSYWKRRGITQLTPSFPFGDLGPFFRQRSSLGVVYADVYRLCKRLPFVGIYFSLRPMLVVNDPELIKNVLVRDFDHFHDRGLYVNEEKDPLSGHLFALGGEQWRHHRSKLTPTFTSGRLKEMFTNLVQIGRVLQDHVAKRAGEDIEIRDVMARYTTDIIASVGFGIENDSINEKGNIFREMGTKVFSPDLKTILRLTSTFFTPKLNALFGFKFIAQEIEDFIMNVVRETLEYRESNKVVRKDMMQLLMQLRNSGTVSIDDRWDIEVSTNKKKLSLEQVTAHAFVFFIAAYETSSTTISFCLFELARNPEIQKKVQQEIDQVLASHNGEITYDNINEMKYLENCIDETLRKYPAVPFLNRECSKDYKIPGTDTTIEKGTSLVIPVLGLHRDPDHYPEPDRFIPERFSNFEDISTKPYLPFGAGPRNCIGLRLGKLQTKAGLVMMLSKFNVRLADETYASKELALDARSVVLMPVGGIKVSISERRAS
uniref:Cytochrome P450 n=1 Tax=Culex pipiens pallens TaxID=42434 RepID=Q6DLW0_CULPA|nr:cytochrome P450 [Culex pipiens pallens]